MGCKKCNEQNDYNPCNPTPCQEPVECSCPTILKSDCVIYSGNDLECSGIVTGQTLTETIEQLDTFICEKVDDITNALTLKNIGDGAKVYKGDDLLGRKELRTVTKTGDLITITENTNDIAVSIDESALNTFIEENQKTYSVANVGTGVEVYKDSTIVGDNTQFNFRTLTSTGNSVTITQGTDAINLEVDIEPTSVFLEEGDNITITGTGTNLDPYIINSTETIITLKDGVTTTVSGDGVVVPYSVEVENLQKTISTFPYTLTDNDDKYTIFIDNGVSNIVINVPDGLVDNFSTVFIQEGTGTVTIQQSGTGTLLYPSTTLQNIIKGQNYWAMIEKKTTTDNYFLLGSLKVV